MRLQLCGSVALSWLTPMMMASFVLDKLRVIEGNGAPYQRAQHRIALPSSGKETARRSGIVLVEVPAELGVAQPADPQTSAARSKATRKGAGC